MIAERRTCVSALVLVGYCLLQVCGAGKVPCTVNETTYSVPDEGGSDCTYSWANASDTGHFVLAHEEGWGEDGPVRSANVSTFITTECFPWVIYKRHCLSEIEEKTSNCTNVCSKKVQPPEGAATETFGNNQQQHTNDEAGIKKTTSRSRIIPLIIIISFVIVLLVGLNYFRSRRTCFSTPWNMKGVEAQAPVEQ